ncbi:MAG: MmcQ-like protein [Flavobacteriaceae bacterium]|nr:MAG: MmcQ-like protein [Flavobacteriaceae bacterium]
MALEQLREYCLSLPFAEEDTPFDQNILVYKVKNKIFCLFDLNTFDFINLKCDPELALTLRDKHPEITPAYHMNKKHWNSIETATEFSKEQYFAWVLDSYHLVVKGLPKKEQTSILEALSKL